MHTLYTIDATDLIIAYLWQKSSDTYICNLLCFKINLHVHIVFSIITIAYEVYILISRMTLNVS